MTVYVLPTPPGPLMDNALQDALQLMVVGITGLPPTSCVPRWQPEPPNQADFGTDWAAFGLMSTEMDVYSYQEQLDLNTLQVEADESLNMLFSFYGPDAQANAGLLQMGIQVQRNRDDLTAINVKLTAMGQPRQVPLLQKQVWVKRVDIAGTFRRRVIRTYALPNINSGSMGLNNEFYVTPIVVSPPA